MEMKEVGERSLEIVRLRLVVSSGGLLASGGTRLESGAGGDGYWGERG